MSILDIIIILLVLTWVGGIGFRIAGRLIHFLIVLAIIFFVIRLLS